MGSDPLFNALMGSNPTPPTPVLTRSTAPHAPRAALSKNLHPPNTTTVGGGAFAVDVLTGIELHFLIERATGHARPAGRTDSSATKSILNSVRTRATRLESVLKALTISSDGKGGAPYNLRVLTLLHALLGAGPHALTAAASAGAISGRAASPAMKIVSDAHRAARLARGAPSADVLGTNALDDVLDPSLENAAECYSVLLARRLTFAAGFAETEANFSLDRWYRRLGIENRAENTRVGFNNSRQARLIAADTRAAAEQLVVVATRTVDALMKVRGPRDAVALTIAEGCNAYVFAEYIRAKSRMMGNVPREVQRNLASACTGAAGTSPSPVEALVRYAGVDAAVAVEVFTIPNEEARAVRIDSKYRRDIVCRFMSFMGLHKALDANGRQKGSVV